MMYYFTHPEPYHLRPLDPVMLILCCQYILALRAQAGAASVLAPAIVPLPEEVAL